MEVESSTVDVFLKQLVMKGMDIVESCESCDTGEKDGQETHMAFMSVSNTGSYFDQLPMDLNRFGGQINPSALLPNCGSNPWNLGGSVRVLSMSSGTV